jgi:hypothetical protein
METLRSQLLHASQACSCNDAPHPDCGRSEWNSAATGRLEAALAASDLYMRDAVAALVTACAISVNVHYEFTAHCRTVRVNVSLMEPDMSAFRLQLWVGLLMSKPSQHHKLGTVACPAAGQMRTD